MLFLKRILDCINSYLEKWGMVKRNNKADRNVFELSDRPVRDSSGDMFDFEHLFVEKIFNIIKEPSFHPLTVAITGAWGIGKTSAIRLLRNRLETSDKKNILINFEPLLEGKLEIVDIIESFYFKLYNELQKMNDKKLL